MSGRSPFEPQPPSESNPARRPQPGTGRSDVEEVEFVDAPAIDVGLTESVVVSRVRRIRRQAPRDEDWPSRRRAGRWAAMAVLAAVFAVLLAVWSLIQISERENAERILQDVLAPLTEVDALLDRDYESLVADAGEAAATGAADVAIPHYPLDIVIPGQELATMSQTELRERILAESASAIYDEGTGTFERESGAAGGGLFRSGAVRFTMAQLTEEAHGAWQIGGAVLLGLAVLLIVTVAALSRDLARIQNVGLALAAAGALMTVATLGARIGLRSAADGAADPLNAALLDIGADAAGVALRNYLIFGVLGLLTAGLATALRMWERRGSVLADMRADG